MLDWWLIGEWHATLRRYIAINAQYSEGWSTSPWYTFALLWLGLSIPPTFFLRYRGFDWKARYQPLAATVLFFAVFLLAHMAISHKEERFMIPATPLFLMLLTPLLAFLIEHRREYRWRLWYLGVVNGVLLLLAVSSAPQRAALGLARYLDQHPEITSVSQVGRIPAGADGVRLAPGDGELRQVDGGRAAVRHRHRGAGAHQDGTGARGRSPARTGGTVPTRAAGAADRGDQSETQCAERGGGGSYAQIM